MELRKCTCANSLRRGILLVPGRASGWSRGVARPPRVQVTRGFVPQAIWLTRIFRESRIVRTDVGSELLVALVFIVQLHVCNGFVNHWPQRLECPRTLGASPALKSLAFDPYQFATHRFICLPRDL